MTLPVTAMPIEQTERPLNPDDLELAPAAERQKLEGSIWQLATEEELRLALSKALDYRGDVTITCKDGAKVEGYIFDCRPAGTLAGSFVRLIPQGGTRKISLSFADVASLAFTGRDTAAGKSWEAWVRKFTEKKAAGEKNIEIKPERLD